MATDNREPTLVRVVDHPDDQTMLFPDENCETISQTARHALPPGTRNSHSATAPAVSDPDSEPWAVRVAPRRPSTKPIRP